jgi:predicted phage tail protein
MPPKKAAASSSKAASEPAGGVDKGVLQQLSFVQQNLHASMTSLHGRVKGLEESNESLRRTRTEMGKETQDFVAYFQGELEQRDAKIDQLRDELRTKEFEQDKAIRRLKEEAQEQMDELVKHATDEKRQLQLKVEALSEKLDELDHYRMNKTAIDAQVAALTDALAKEKRERRDEVASVERRWMEDKKRMLDEQKAQFLEMKQRARFEAQNRLDVDMRKIVVDSKRSADELRFQREQMKILRGEAKGLTEQNKALAREVEIAADKEHLLAVQSAHRERERAEMLDRIRSLEGSVGEMAREFERKRSTDVARASQGMELLQTEVEGLRTLLRMKNQELRTVRRLSQAIISQRTEVEQFLLESLEEVKKEAREYRENERRAAERAATIGLGGLKLPVIAPSRGMVSPVRPSSTPSGPTSYKDLKPDEKEKVLSLLFGRINQSESSVNREDMSRTGRVSQLSMTSGFATAGIGRPFGLAGDIPATLPGDEEMVPPGPLASMLVAEASSSESKLDQSVSRSMAGLA